MDNRLHQDLISDLPVEILENILMCLPISDAIRTSILSTKWRHIWVSLPELVFEYDMGFSLGAIQEKRLKHFVTSTLFLHQGPIHKFQLYAGDDMTHCPITDMWLLSLSRKDIKELRIGIGGLGEFDHFDVPPCLYNCQKLTLLELGGCRLSPPPPTFKGFLCLRSLILRNVKAPSGLIQSVVDNSPLLEHLECALLESFELRTSAPNLKSLYFDSTFKETHLCAPLLTKMEIALWKQFDNDGEVLVEIMHRYSDCSYTKFLGGVTNLESLIGHGDFTKYLSIGMEYYRNPLVFHHLKVIQLHHVNFYDPNEILVVVHLIMGSANLRELEVTPLCNEKAAAKAPPMDFWDSECPQNCRFENLKVIKLAEFGDSLHEMKFIKFLLESSPMLETMIYEPPYPTGEEEILGYCRASTSAKILFNETKYPYLYLEDLGFYV